MVAEVRRLGGDVLVVSFAPPARVAAFLAASPQPMVMVSDPTLAAYRAFGLQRAPWRSMFRLGVLSRFLKLVLRGWLPRKPATGDDVFQLGGDFVLDAAGRVCYAHPSAEPTDRPRAEEVVAALARLV